MKLKYIRFQRVGFVVAPNTFNAIHADVAAAVSDRPLSAGFFTIDNGSALCFGKSESLRLESRPDDSEALTKFLGLARGAAQDSKPS